MIIWYMSSPYAACDHQWPTSDVEVEGICAWFASSDDFLAVRMRDNDDFVGYISLNQTEDAGVYNLGYCFNVHYHGQGYAYESCKALVDYAFHDLSAAKIITGTADENIPSCKLLGKLGMIKVENVMASFRNNENGLPIEFCAGVYELQQT